MSNTERIQCDTCMGTGEMDTLELGTMDCPVCDGVGSIPSHWIDPKTGAFIRDFNEKQPEEAPHDHP